ncbi:MAG: HDIG domain-containing protein [Eubacteriaceae bacterium]|nr:HDIG domain-containing protein [Eubacteriaceae bacterium]MDD4507938.1 HDIG domain-containing protein [Eubacteriaceae bacterium]
MKEKKQYDEFYKITGQIIESPEFQNLKRIPHHGNGLYDHSMAVAYYSFVLAKKMGLDYRSVARGGLLHDFTFEHWKNKRIDTTGIERIKDMHGFKHPKDALKYSKMIFYVNDKESDIIVKHMFPLTISPPAHMESWVVSIVDKGIAIEEMVREHTPRKIYRRYKLGIAS